MAHFLQGLIAAGLGLALWTAAAPAQPASRIKFSHPVHAKLGDIGPVLKMARERGTHLRPDQTAPGAQCQACHSGVAAGVARASLSKMGDCLVCHPKIDPPFSCNFCHTQPSNELKPASHTGDFLDRHSAGLAKLNLEKSECAVCHGRKFTCLGCH